jgi:hypothetical protein
MWKWIFVAQAGTALFAQSDVNDYSLTYGANYSSRDRKRTMEPSTVIPGSFTYRPLCSILLGIDDDSLVFNKTPTSIDKGTGNLGFEGHWTFWRGFRDINGECAAKKLSSLRLDYVATVPVPGTLEGTELVHQIKTTYSHPTLDAGRLLSLLSINAGLNVSGITTGGNTVNALATGNYTRYFHAGGAWGFEAEVDLASRSKLGPSSAIAIVAIDGAFDKDQVWGIRFGSSFGLTLYAPKFSPFLQLSYNGNFKRR